MIIPWERLGDFVAGEQSMRDFPCTFNEVPKLGHKEGQAANAKESSFLQKIRFQCEYGPLDRTGEVKKDVEKIFASALKSKLSTNQKNAKKRVEKLEKKAAKEAAKVVAAEAKQIKGGKRGGAVSPPATPVVEESYESDTEPMRPRFKSGIPALANLGPGR